MVRHCLPNSQGVGEAGQCGSHSNRRCIKRNGYEDVHVPCCTKQDMCLDLRKH